MLFLSIISVIVFLLFFLISVYVGNKNSDNTAKVFKCSLIVAVVATLLFLLVSTGLFIVNKVTSDAKILEERQFIKHEQEL